MLQIYLILKKNVIINKEELKLHQDVTICYICGKRFSRKFAKDKIYRKVIDHCRFIGAAHST